MNDRILCTTHCAESRTGIRYASYCSKKPPNIQRMVPAQEVRYQEFMNHKYLQVTKVALLQIVLRLTMLVAKLAGGFLRPSTQDVD